MDILTSELDVPAKYMELMDGRICATVHKSWLANLWNVGPINFLTHNRLSMDEIAARPSLDDLGPSWTRIYVRAYEKQNKNAIPLPRDRHSTSAKVQPELTFAQLLRYVAETNYRNLWKESYKKYYSVWNPSEQKEQSYAIPSSSDVAVMREVLARMYGCSLIKIRNGQVVAVNRPTITNSHCNLLPSLLAIETSVAFVTIHEQIAHYSLQECVMYSPAALSTSYSKPLFLVYQLLRLSRDLYDQGLALGEITLGDILIMDNFTIQVMPKLSDNVYLDSESDNQDKENKLSPVEQDDTKKCTACRKVDVASGSSDFGHNENIEKLCEHWLHGQISNFDYLTALNNLAGRRYGDPSCHHVMPWVTDFSSRCGRNWRDLTKSKFRLNKGDRQLDLTFDSAAIDVSHHVSDVLSEITYYVYLSRRYTKALLCKHVRSHWVPWEYPVSIQRLHEWSPDECIPQFFTDPSVFKSIHEDLPDLELPSWARSPEDFIEKHREALESLYVSERLHQWIDLTFGYKLSGVAAIKSKNVCLQLVDNHTSLTNFGVVQLFTQPHPQRIVPSPYWSKIPPRLRNSVSNSKITRNERSGDEISEDEGQSSGIDEEECPVTTLNVARSSPLALSRLLSRSRSSLPAVDDNPNKPEKSTTQTIFLPKDYNPVWALLQVETTHVFMNRTSHRTYKPDIAHHTGTANYKQIVACGRMKEQQILGCLIVEIFLSSKFRATWNTGRTSFASRLQSCANILRVAPEALPKCVRNAVALLLQLDIIPKSYGIYNELFDYARTNETNPSILPFRYHMVTGMGLPPPSAHQFLQPVLSGNLYPSSKYFQYLFNLVEMLQEYNDLVRELNSVISDDADPETTVKKKIRYLCKISECKVKAVARELERLLPQIGTAMETSLQLIVPHVQQIMDERYSAVLAAWHLFDPIAKALGPKETADTFLSSILRLYENGSIMDSLRHAEVLPPGLIAKFRTMRLYHRSFLLKLMVRLGLRRFLENFVTPLVEAVGGYRDYPQGSLATNLYRTGNLKNCDLTGSCVDGEAILSPLDEDSSIESENNGLPPCQVTVEEYPKNSITLNSEVEDVFTIETEDSPSPSDNVTIPIIDIQAELNLILNDDLADDTKNSPPGSVRSPTIPIPRRSDGNAGKSVTDFNSIGCHVGSKTSSEALVGKPFVGSYGGRLQAVGSANDCNGVGQVPKRLVIREDEDVRVINRKITPSECKVSEMSAESVIWLSHRLGPVLTARHLSRNLLRMLTLCYAGRSNLAPVLDGDNCCNETTITGDRNAVKVLECLTAIATLYGEHIILLQYLAHMTELLTLCKRKLTPNLEGGVVSCMALLVHITPCLSDAFLMEALHETIVKSILHPTVRVLSTTRYTFPNGAMARSAAADKYLEAIYAISVRLGSPMTKNQLAVPIQRFFLAFDKAFGPKNIQIRTEFTEKVPNNDRCSPNTGNFERETKYNDARDWTLGKDSGCETQLLSGVNSNVAISYSPPIIEEEDIAKDPQRNKAFEELKRVFTLRFAHKAYLLFYRRADESTMEEMLKNHELVRELCHRYEREMRLDDTEGSVEANLSKSRDFSADSETWKGIGSFGNISVIGNRIEFQTEIPGMRSQPTSDIEQSSNREALTSGPSVGRQLRGNWLAYWEHEIGRPDKDSKFNVKQIKLQSFGGHTNSIRCIYALDNENSFMSGARDKTVKLWSLRSQGDGGTVSTCQYTYTGHKKSILALTFLESLRYAVSCDSAVHCWDPFMGSLLGCPESSRPAPVNTLAASAAPSTSLLAATTDITLRVIDCRTFQYVNEMKVSMNPTGLIRCIAVAPSGYWVALGQTSGFLTILDIRTGLIIASWKGHECEILQLEALNETTLLSSSLDQTIAVWSAIDGKFKFHLKGPTEPVHCMAVYAQQLISGTTANRIGVHTAVDASATFSSSKLRSDAFKGVITALEVLPLNRLLLLGADNGGISLLC